MRTFTLFIICCSLMINTLTAATTEVQVRVGSPGTSKIQVKSLAFGNTTYVDVFTGSESGTIIFDLESGNYDFKIHPVGSAHEVIELSNQKVYNNMFRTAYLNFTPISTGGGGGGGGTGGGDPPQTPPPQKQYSDITFAFNDYCRKVEYGSYSYYPSRLTDTRDITNGTYTFVFYPKDSDKYLPLTKLIHVSVNTQIEIDFEERPIDLIQYHVSTVNDTISAYSLNGGDYISLSGSSNTFSMDLEVGSYTLSIQPTQRGVYQDIVNTHFSVTSHGIPKMITAFQPYESIDLYTVEVSVNSPILSYSFGGQVESFDSEDVTFFSIPQVTTGLYELFIEPRSPLFHTMTHMVSVSDNVLLEYLFEQKDIEDVPIEDIPVPDFVEVVEELTAGSVEGDLNQLSPVSFHAASDWPEGSSFVWGGDLSGTGNSVTQNLAPGEYQAYLTGLLLGHTFVKEFSFTIDEPEDEPIEDISTPTTPFRQRLNSGEAFHNLSDSDSIFFSLGYNALVPYYTVNFGIEGEASSYYEIGVYRNGSLIANHQLFSSESGYVSIDLFLTNLADVDQFEIRFTAPFNFPITAAYTVSYDSSVVNEFEDGDEIQHMLAATYLLEFDEALSKPRGDASDGFLRVAMRTLRNHLPLYDAFYGAIFYTCPESAVNNVALCEAGTWFQDALPFVAGGIAGTAVTAGSAGAGAPVGIAVGAGAYVATDAATDAAKLANNSLAASIYYYHGNYEAAAEHVLWAGLGGATILLGYTGLEDRAVKRFAEEPMRKAVKLLANMMASRRSVKIADDAAANATFKAFALRPRGVPKLLPHESTELSKALALAPDTKAYESLVDYPKRDFREMVVFFELASRGATSNLAKIGKEESFVNVNLYLHKPTGKYYFDKSKAPPSIGEDWDNGTDVDLSLKLDNDSGQRIAVQVQNYKEQNYKSQRKEVELQAWKISQAEDFSDYFDLPPVIVMIKEDTKKLVVQKTNSSSFEVMDFELELSSFERNSPPDETIPPEPITNSNGSGGGSSSGGGCLISR